MRLEWKLGDCTASWNSGCTLLDVSRKCNYFNNEVGENFISTIPYDKAIEILPNLVDKQTAYNEMADILISQGIEVETVAEHIRFLYSGNCSYVEGIYHFRAEELLLKQIKDGYEILDIRLTDVEKETWEIFKAKDFKNMGELYEFIGEQNNRK